MSREQRVAQVVLHLRPGEFGPQIVDELNELRGHELGLVGRRALQEVEAARMGAIGQAKDMDSARMTCRDAFEDVGREIAVGIDDRGARVRVQDAQGKVRDERALARSGCSDHGHVSLDRLQRNAQRSARVTRR